MKNLALSIATAILLLSLSSCQKLLEYAESHGYPAPVKSLIRKINYSDSAHYVPGVPFTVETNSFTFIYNSAHDPIYAIRETTGTGVPSYIFRYDASGRLTDLIAAYDTAITMTNVESWHKFTYEPPINTMLSTG
ncbi:MAG: hypothetical protein JST68_03420 [Bacteroidetes bacterium]|nr:hypothetical protein [Bacteroidota bacterium]